VAIHKPVRILLLLVAATGIAGVAATAYLFRPHLTSAERGRRLAEATGCFACHGPEGTRGAGNPGRTDRTVPSFGSLMMYASNAAETREWIANGVTAARAKSETWRTERDKGALRMPAFGDRLSKQEIDDLVAFVRAATSEPSPGDSLASAGLERAEALGCVGCHGAGGRYARRNPGSLKGYVPPWDGEDWSELVTSQAEFREWVERGVSHRFEKNPVARFFLERAVLKMPAYEGKLEPGDVDALWAYVSWLRGGAPKS
jgi:mono/diheme cytochrome c family protein